MRVKVILEFDDNKLGQGWMNIDNLKLLLYTEQKTKEDLLKVVYYGEENRGGDKQNQSVLRLL